MWRGAKVSVIFSTFNEKDSIRQCINDFFATQLVDEIVVVNNNAVFGTREEVAETKARQVLEKRQGYGYGYRRGLREASGDIIILSEPDGTFEARDVKKLLVYSDDFEVVFGTRTTSALIAEGANMGFFLKWGNWAVAKAIEILFNTTHLSDVGCTMRLIKKEALKKIAREFTVGESHFGLEFMLRVIQGRLSFIEIPLHYNKRVGRSTVTGSWWKAVSLGLRMIFFIVKSRLTRNPFP